MRRSFEVATVLVMLAAGGARAQGRGPSPVAVAPVVERGVARARSFFGTAVPLKTSRVGSMIAGRVESFEVDAGQAVKKGQVLARLESSTVELSIAEAKALLQLRRLELLELKNGERPEVKAAAAARLRAAEASKSYWDAQLVRIQGLQRKKLISLEELQQVRQSAARFAAEVAEAQAVLAQARSGPREERLAQAQARVVGQQRTLDRLKNELRKHTILAPFSGEVVQEHTEVGEWLAQGAPVVEIVHLSIIDVVISLPEDYTSALRIGAEAVVRFGALPARRFVGKIVGIVARADRQARTFPVKVRIRNERVGGAPLLKAGMSAHVNLALGEVLKRLLVSKDALVLGKGPPHVYAVIRKGAEKAGVVRKVAIKVLSIIGGFVAVEGELKAGEWLIVRGNERLRTGASVLVTKVLHGEAKLVNPSLGREGKKRAP